MKHLKKSIIPLILILALTLSVVLCGCEIKINSPIGSEDVTVVPADDTDDIDETDEPTEAPTEEPTEAPAPSLTVLTDGIYCCFYEDSSIGSLCNRVMRFYSDGTMISDTIVQDSTTTKKFPTSSFNYSNAHIKGTWTLAGDQISFTTTSSTGTVDYWGDFYGDYMILDSHSNINDHRTSGRRYDFYSFDDMGWN